MKHGQRSRPASREPPHPSHPLPSPVLTSLTPGAMVHLPFPEPHVIRSVLGMCEETHVLCQSCCFMAGTFKMCSSRPLGTKFGFPLLNLEPQLLSSDTPPSHVFLYAGSFLSFRGRDMTRNTMSKPALAREGPSQVRGGDREAGGWPGGLCSDVMLKFCVALTTFTV